MASNLRGSQQGNTFQSTIFHYFPVEQAKIYEYTRAIWEVEPPARTCNCFWQGGTINLKVEYK